MAVVPHPGLTRRSAPWVAAPGGRGPFAFVILYLVLEYGRPQEIVPGLAALHLPGVVTAVLALLICTSRRLSLADRETKLFIALLVLMTVHIPFALNNYWAFHTARAMLMTFAAYLGVITFVDTLPRFKLVVGIWLAIHAYLSILGIQGAANANMCACGGSATGSVGVGGFLGDENEFAMALNMVIPFAFFLFLAERRPTRRVLYIALAALFAFTSVLTFSRAGFLGLLAVGGYCLVRSRKKLLSLMLVVLLATLIVALAPDTYWGEIASIQEGTHDPNAEDRIYEWKIGGRMFAANPLIGVGQGNFPFEFRTYEIASGFQDGFRGRSRAGRSSHSLYVDLLSELGLVGAALWGTMLWCCRGNGRSLRQALTFRGNAWTRSATARQESSAGDIDRVFYLSLAIEASLVAYLVGGLFNSVLYYPNFWLLMAFLIALKKIVGKMHDDDPARD
jgi:probable O-glycosylation ligase (exosortase A-associated)